MTNLKKKICENSLCKEVFLSKNPKKRFCGMHCKNQAAYQHRITHYDWEEKMAKARLGDIQVLERLVNLNIEEITLKELQNMGFIRECSYYPYSEKDNIKNI